MAEFGKRSEGRAKVNLLLLNSSLKLEDGSAGIPGVAVGRDQT